MSSSTDNNNFVTPNQSQINEILTQDRKTFADLLKQKPVSPLSGSNKKLIEGVIIDIFQKKNLALVEIKTETGIQKSQAFVNLNEFVDEKGEKVEVEISDEYQFVLESSQDDGALSVSRSKVARELSWANLKEAFEHGTPIEGVIFQAINGGLCIDFGGNIGFIPSSQLDTGPVKNVAALMMRKEKFKIFSLDEKARTVIASRRALLEESRSQVISELLSTMSEGAVYDGVVKNITSYGAFVDLGSVDGLLHISDITWDKISHPSEILDVDQKIKVQILSIDPDKKRVSLGMKQLLENPWNSFKDVLTEGTVLEGKITKIVDYGIFVAFKDKIEGLVHSTEIAWTKDKMISMMKSFTVDQEVKVNVVSADLQAHKLSLSIKRLEENPWQKFVDNNAIGARIRANIVNVTNFGLFIQLDYEINGFVHFSDLSWDSRSETQLNNYSVGDEIEVIFLNADVKRQRLSFGIKQCSGDPMESLRSSLSQGSIVPATVSDVKKEGIEVKLFNKVDCFLKRSQLSKEKSFTVTENYAVGQDIEVYLSKVDFDNRNILASVTKIEEIKVSNIMQKYSGGGGGATLKDAVSSLESSDEE